MLQFWHRHITTRNPFRQHSRGERTIHYPTNRTANAPNGCNNRSDRLVKTEKRGTSRNGSLIVS
eukprot:scaffold10583_cov290-Chaetoceros_neogracile.AAC.19